MQRVPHQPGNVIDFFKEQIDNVRIGGPLNWPEHLNNLLVMCNNYDVGGLDKIFVRPNSKGRLIFIPNVSVPYILCKRCFDYLYSKLSTWPLYLWPLYLCVKFKIPYRPKKGILTGDSLHPMHLIQPCAEHCH